MSSRILTALAPLGLLLCACAPEEETLPRDETVRADERRTLDDDAILDDEARTAREAAFPREQATPGAVAAADRDFVSKAARSGRFEVESSRLAQTKASSPELQELAGKLVEDHTAANRELETLAREKGVPVPTDLDAEHRRVLDELRQAEGMAFDEAYHAAQVRAHDDAVALFERASSDSQDPDLRSFASKTLPTLREHRSRLDEIGVEAGAQPR